jgi:tellurium resistance protein TerD
MLEIKKDQKVNLTKMMSNSTKLTVGLGWKVNNQGVDFDLDASAFMLNINNEIRDRKDFVYYNNLQDSLGVMKHSGDNLKGGEGDCEQIQINLDKVPEEIGHLTFVVTIHDAINRQQTFGQVSDAYIRIFDTNTNVEYVRYILGEENFYATSVVIGDILRRNNEWYLDAVGVSFSGGLEAIAKDFDIKPKK